MLTPVLALALIQQANAVPDYKKGSGLYEECRATIREQDGATQSEDAMNSMSCIGYIHGFLDGITAAGSHAICPSGASFGTMARVYVAWMEKNPKYMDAGRADGLAAALLDSYACPVPKTP